MCVFHPSAEQLFEYSVKQRVYKGGIDGENIPVLSELLNIIHNNFDMQFAAKFALLAAALVLNVAQVTAIPAPVSTSHLNVTIAALD